MAKGFKTGTVNLTGGSAAFAIASGDLLTGVSLGDTLYCAGLAVPISTVDTSGYAAGTLMFNWPGADQTGAAFVVEQKYRDAIELAASVQEIAYDLLTEGRFLPVTGTPASSYGEDGQWAINATTLEVWAKASGAWTLKGTLIGSVWRKGAGAPSAGVGVDGDWYIRTDGTPPGDIYHKESGAYVSVLNLQGPTGPTGPVPWGEPVEWEPGLTAVVGPPATLVTNGGQTYVCNTPHTTGATFAGDAAKWTLLAAKAVDTSRDSLSLGSDDAPQFAGVNVGHASDALLAREDVGALMVAGQHLFSLLDKATWAQMIAGGAANVRKVITADLLRTLLAPKFKDYAASMPINFAEGRVFWVTVSGAIDFALPTNVVPGDWGFIFMENTTAAQVSPTWNAVYRFSATTKMKCKARSVSFIMYYAKTEGLIYCWPSLAAVSTSAGPTYGL